MFTVSYEPFNYEARLSAASRSIEGLSKIFSRMRASVLAGFPGAELEALEASPEAALWPLGGLPISKHRNVLILLKGRRVSAASFLSMKLKEDELNIPEDALEKALRSSAESGCSPRFCVQVLQGSFPRVKPLGQEEEHFLTVLESLQKAEGEGAL